MDTLNLVLSGKAAIEKYTRDLTAAALRGELEPVSCRDAEIERLITILVRHTKNNPVLLGDAGVGKTAVVEGLAQRIAAGDVPDGLKTARIFSLSHIDLIAGTSFRGQYEKRLQAVIQQATADPDAVLFIDELHNLIGAGTAIGAPMDAANMLKPALAGGQMRVIGATTESEFENYIRADSALERRFQPVWVHELDIQQTLDVLRTRKPRLEMHHLVLIPENVLEAAAHESSRYLPDRRQPDRSLDLLDEACARVRMRRFAGSDPELTRLQGEREGFMSAEQTAVHDILRVAEGEGTAVERFSRNTFRTLEKIGLEFERFFTGTTTPRRPLPEPDSLKSLKKLNPEKRLADIHRQRLGVESEILALLERLGRHLTVEDIHETARAMSSTQPR